MCTGNLCRSPLAEALLRRRTEPVDAQVRTASAGLLREGRPAEPDTMRVAGDYGLDLSEHRSRRLTRDLVARADLVIGMARIHVREVVALEPDAWHYTFTLKELARRARAAGPRPAHLGLSDWLPRLTEDRSPDDLLGSSVDDDVADPIGSPRAVFRRTAEEIDRAVHDIVAMIWPSVAGEP